MTKFSSLGLSASMLKAITTLGYDKPTEIQARAIPAILNDEDVCAAAKTGTGKTAAFLLPCLDRLKRARVRQAPRMLVLSPTRELAQQIYDCAKIIAKHKKLRVNCITGGVPQDGQIANLKRGADIVIACPGRLEDIYNQGLISLDDVDVLVLDEADRMLDMGFIPSISRIVEACNPDRQTLLFSATLDGSIKDVMESLTCEPHIIEAHNKGEVSDYIDQYIIHTNQRLKHELLARVLADKGSGRVIVFTRTKRRADTTQRQLAYNGYKAEVIHSDKSQAQRSRALKNFAAGTTPILVATDVLARGIDISQVNYVVNLDLPLVAEDYIHRIGRTGRCKSQGFAISFVTPETKNLLDNIVALTKQKPQELKLETWDEGLSLAHLCARPKRKRTTQDQELIDAAKELKRRQNKKANKATKATRPSSASAKKCPGGLTRDLQKSKRTKLRSNTFKTSVDSKPKAKTSNKKVSSRLDSKPSSASSKTTNKKQQKQARATKVQGLKRQQIQNQAR